MLIILPNFKVSFIVSLYYYIRSVFWDGVVLWLDCQLKKLSKIERGSYHYQILIFYYADSVHQAVNGIIEGT